MIEIPPNIALDEGELDFSFIRASGPGGQNVNKVATAVQMRFDARRSPSLPNDVSTRLQKLAGSRLTNEGVIVITANGSINKAVEAMRAGAHEFLVKPFDEARLLSAVANVPGWAKADFRHTRW